MAGASRPASAAQLRRNAMRPPINRPASARALASHTSHGGVRSNAVSPAHSESQSSVLSKSRSPPTGQHAGVKRKERDFETDSIQETNINVVVRCRGRNEREVQENSGVILSTDGARGTAVELSMGPNAVSNKTYSFDRVFSPAADQAMIFDDVVAPILDEMLLGFNCTIFAYGQTGTGKTYTMSGDMADTFGLVSDSAGIIPRVLQSLFARLEADEAESSVKCSYIELYNEELRDLLSAEEHAKLKIYDETNRKGEVATLVQGMEESHIKNASEGVKLLQDGSFKRQVAATKCNDLSSRSHTVFTVTAYVKRVVEGSEDVISAGKLNLVDLAGSENIQRSGAENKRAAEAGLINKSLLTLGRVINALVDKSKHIPYRESKLTRILQDSLGGRTKTCIIATVSPARSNLEETISTLDYAFRAKNIRNKPQTNSLISKKTLLREFTAEIEKLKSELISTRQRNGVYMSNQAYEEMTIQSESRRILSEEQKAKIETMESNLRSKIQDLFSLTTNFHELKKDHEGTVLTLDETKSLLEQTEFVLSTTKDSLDQETTLREAHQQTEKELSSVGATLVSTADRMVADVNGLHSKLRRRSDLQAMNKSNWKLSQAQISDTTRLVKRQLQDFRDEQERLARETAQKVQSYVTEQLQRIADSKEVITAHSDQFDRTQKDVCQQISDAHEKISDVFGEITVTREDLKGRVAQGLDSISTAAGRITNEVTKEMDNFQSQLHSSFSSLGQDFKNTFETLAKDLTEQQKTIIELQRQAQEAGTEAIEASQGATHRLNKFLEDERETSAAERRNLLSKITALIDDAGAEQDTRLLNKINSINDDLSKSRSYLSRAQEISRTETEAWNDRAETISRGLLEKRDQVKAKLKADWDSTSRRGDAIQASTKSIHEETVQTVGQQVQDLGSQLHALDDFVARGRAENIAHLASHLSAVSSLATSSRESYEALIVRASVDHDLVSAFSSNLASTTDSIHTSLSTLDHTAQQPLAELRTNILAANIREYSPTGDTPPKQTYQYPRVLPRTSNPSDPSLDLPSKPASSPSKAAIFTDSPPAAHVSIFSKSVNDVSSASRLRELDVNSHSANNSSGANSLSSLLMASDKENATFTVPPSFLESLPSAAAAAGEKEDPKGGRPRRRQTGGVRDGAVGRKMRSAVGGRGRKKIGAAAAASLAEGAENLEHTIPLFRGSIGTGSTAGAALLGGAGRRLRSAAVIEE